MTMLRNRIIVFIIGNFCIMDNKIKMIQQIKNNKQTDFKLEHVLSILLDNSVNFIEVRRFIQYKYPQSQIIWSDIQDKQLYRLARECEKYIKVNEQTWKQQYERYLFQKDQLKEIKLKVSAKMSINSGVSNLQMRYVLKDIMIQREKLAAIHKNTEQLMEIQNQNRQIRQLLQLLQNQINYENKNEGLQDEDDIRMTKRVKQIASKFHVTLVQQKSVHDQVQKKLVQQSLDEYNRKLLVMKKRMYQIFLYYCRQNNISSLTFEEYNKNMKQIDLKLFLKYFKDFKFTEYNKHRYKVTTITLTFRAQANNGLYLTFQKFWNIHKHLFDMKDLTITHNDIINSDHSKLAQFKLNINEQISKFQQFNEVVNEAKTKEIFNFFNMRSVQTEASPQIRVKKSPSLSIIREKSQGKNQVQTEHSVKLQSSLSSRYFPKSQASSKGLSQIIKKRNFIHEIRKQIPNQQQFILNKNSSIKRSDSIWSLSSDMKKSKVEVNLPKILKLSTQEISNQGIYKSLKHFASYDYMAQQKKLRQLIGMPQEQEDKEYLQAYLKKQMKEKKQKQQREKNEKREQRRKKIIEVINNKQHQCKRFHAHDMQPYMRF